MKQTCKYHPGEQATWYCPGDGIDFCEECVASDDSPDGGRARCFLCNKALEPAGRQVAREPFWQILSHFIQFPLARDLMLVVAATALVTAVLPQSWLGVALAVAVGAPLGQMGVGIIERTVQGVMRAPDWQVLRQTEFWARGVQLWLVFAVAGVALGYGYLHFGMLAGSGLALLAWMVIPAVMIRVELDGNLLVPLLAPLRLLSVLGVLGLDYVLAGGFLFFAFTSAAILLSILYDLLPQFIGFPLGFMVVGWLFLVSSHLLGYLICQHREALGYLSPLHDERAVRQRRARRPEEERRQAVLLREGRFEKVVGIYRSRLEKQPDSLPLNEQYEKLVSALGRDEDLLEHGARYLELLIRHQQEFRALELIRRYRELDPAFRPGSAQGTWDMAKLLADNDQPKLAVNLLLDLHKRAPTWPGLAQAYLFVARLLKSEFKLDGKAEQYLRFVETRFRDPKSRELARVCRQELFGSA